jgi:hypothetical protein
MTPTFLDYANVSQPPAGAIYRGNETYPIMGKSIKPVIEGMADRVHKLFMISASLASKYLKPY